MLNPTYTYAAYWDLTWYETGAMLKQPFVYNIHHTASRDSHMIQIKSDFLFELYWTDVQIHLPVHLYIMSTPVVYSVPFDARLRSAKC